MAEYTLKEVAEHKGPKDAWLIIHGKGKPNVLLHLKMHFG